jgi:hypothetical protein
VRPITWKTWISAIALVALAAGCGETLTKREYIRRGDALCARYARGEINADEIHDAADARRAFDSIVNQFADLRSGFDAMRSPQAFRADAMAWHEALLETEALIRDNRDALVAYMLRDDESQLAELERESRPIERRLERAAHRLHLRRCVEAVGE